MLSVAGWRATMGALVSSAGVFHNASLVNVLQEPSKNSSSIKIIKPALGTNWPRWAASDRPAMWRWAALLAKSCSVIALAVAACCWLWILCVAAREEPPPGLDCSLMQRPFPEFCLGFVHAVRELHWWKGTSGSPAQGRSGESRFFRAPGSWVLSISKDGNPTCFLDPSPSVWPP